MNLFSCKVNEMISKLARSVYANKLSKKSTIKTISKNNTDGRRPAIKITKIRFELF